MRYSTTQPSVIDDLGEKLPGRRRRSTPTLLGLCRHLEEESTEEERTGSILLVGGLSPGEVAVRAAQSVLRFDRGASCWSHAALILEWPTDAPLRRIKGVEVSLASSPSRIPGQLPERNGVQEFTLADYANAKRHPNVAIAIVKPGKEAIKKLLAAARTPMREVTRYRFYEWLGPWHAHIHTGVGNPVLERVPHPGAAFCEYAFAAAGLDLVPGAIDPNATPETIWGTLKHWQDAMAGARPEIRVAAFRRDRPSDREDG